MLEVVIPEEKQVPTKKIENPPEVFDLAMRAIQMGNWRQAILYLSLFGSWLRVGLEMHQGDNYAFDFPYDFTGEQISLITRLMDVRDELMDVAVKLVLAEKHSPELNLLLNDFTTGSNFVCEHAKLCDLNLICEGSADEVIATGRQRVDLKLSTDGRQLLSRYVDELGHAAEWQNFDIAYADEENKEQIKKILRENSGKILDGFQHIAPESTITRVISTAKTIASVGAEAASPAHLLTPDLLDRVQFYYYNLQCTERQQDRGKCPFQASCDFVLSSMKDYLKKQRVDVSEISLTGVLDNDLKTMSDCLTAETTKEVVDRYCRSFLVLMLGKMQSLANNSAQDSMAKIRALRDRVQLPGIMSVPVKLESFQAMLTQNLSKRVDCPFDASCRFVQLELIQYFVQKGCIDSSRAFSLENDDNIITSLAMMLEYDGVVAQKLTMTRRQEMLSLLRLIRDLQWDTSGTSKDKLTALQQFVQGVTVPSPFNLFSSTKFRGTRRRILDFLSLQAAKVEARSKLWGQPVSLPRIAAVPAG